MRLDVCNLSTKRASSEPWSLLYGLSKSIISINMHFNERMHASVSVSASHGSFPSSESSYGRNFVYFFLN